jgi:hypothetical protein
VFYETGEMPSGPASFFPTRDEAVDVTRHTISLALCRACGFIGGSSSDPAPRQDVASDTPPRDPAAALLLCRHAFARVAQPRRFLHRVRELLAGQPGARVSFELPDARHSLGEGAYWTACRDERSHFTPGSLARLVRAAGFDVVDIRRADDGDASRFTLEAQAADGPTPMRFGLEDDLAAITDAADGFAAAAHRQAARWRRIVNEFRADGLNVALWGADGAAVAFLSMLDASHIDLPVVLDPRPAAQGCFLAGTGQRVVAPDATAPHALDLVILLDAAQRTEAQARLDRLQPPPRILQP